MRSSRRNASPGEDRRSEGELIGVGGRCVGRRRVSRGGIYYRRSIDLGISIITVVTTGNNTDHEQTREKYCNYTLHHIASIVTGKPPTIQTNQRAFRSSSA